MSPILLRYVSDDGGWRVSVVSVGGRQRLRIERSGGRRGSRVWFLVNDVASVEEVEQYVPLASLHADTEPVL